MSRFFGGVAAVIILGSSLGLPGLAVARADLYFPPTSLDGRCYLSARLWGMGGAATALAQAPDGLPASPGVANPAAAAFARTDQIGIALMEVQLVVFPQQGVAENVAETSDSEQIYVSVTPVLDYAEAGSPSDSPSPAPRPMLSLDGLRANLAGQCPFDTRLAWGISTETSQSVDLRLLETGLLYRGPYSLSLGLGWSGLSAAGRSVSQTAVMGLAYETGRWAIAADVFKSAEGMAPGADVFAGLECRVSDGFALRAGSAGGHLTYGIGIKRGRWSMDLARVNLGGESVRLPGATLGPASNVTVVSVSWME